MPSCNYLIVGGGMTADAAVGGIRETDPEGSIGVIAAEPHAPYDRPPLTKGLWKDQSVESIWRQTAAQNVTLHLGRHARSLDPQNKQIVDDHGSIYRFDKLLLATGGTPHRLPFGGDQVIYYRTVDDYERLRAQTGRGQRFAVIGGGFIGSEIAAALAMNGENVVMVFPDEGIGGRVFPSDLAGFLNDFYRKKGIEVLAETRATGWESRQGKSILKTRGTRDVVEREIAADVVVAGIGVRPNIELAQAAGLEVENSIRVDRSLRTSHPDIFAAGDVAEFYNPALDQRLRVEHEDNANSMGRLAGRSMAGQLVAYDHLPFFYSDLFELGYEAVGDVDARLETVADWKELYREGVIYYLRDGRVRGVLLWNVWEQVDAARTLIAEAGRVRADDLRGRLPT